MSRYSAGAKTTAGSTTLPLFSVYAGNSASGTLREFGVFNTTVTAVDLELVRLSSTGTRGAATGIGRHSSLANSAQCGAYESHTGAPTIAERLGYRATLGAAVGAGMIFTFGDVGLEIPFGSNGIGIIVASGSTGQICQTYAVWDE